MAFYRIVAADSRSPRDGRFIEQLGYYDPLKDPAEIKVDEGKVLDWLGKGAQPSETVKSLLSRVGIMETWHYMRQGRSPEEIATIQEEARKRAEAVAAMERRAKESEKPEAESAPEPRPAEAPKSESADAEPAASDAAGESAGSDEPEVAAEPEGAGESTGPEAMEQETQPEEPAKKADSES
jgi:small subunit ribosomal protein S16